MKYSTIIKWDDRVMLIVIWLSILFFALEISYVISYFIIIPIIPCYLMFKQFKWYKKWD